MEANNFDVQFESFVYKDDTNKVLENDTVTPDTLLSGVTAHDKDGVAIIGTYQAPSMWSMKFKLTRDTREIVLPASEWLKAHSLDENLYLLFKASDFPYYDSTVGNGNGAIFMYFVHQKKIGQSIQFTIKPKYSNGSFASFYLENTSRDVYTKNDPFVNGIYIYKDGSIKMSVFGYESAFKKSNTYEICVFADNSEPISV